MKILLDNTVMSNFAVIERPDLLNCILPGQIATTKEAFAELQAGISKGLIPSGDWSWLDVLSLTPQEQKSFALLTGSLGDGEASCLAMAASRGYKVLTDDRMARCKAHSMTIPISGTLGALKLLVEQGTLTQEEGELYLQRLIATGYHSPVTKMTALL
jgi:predicted nucleic acid-binding protein